MYFAISKVLTITLLPRRIPRNFVFLDSQMPIGEEIGMIVNQLPAAFIWSVTTRCPGHRINKPLSSPQPCKLNICHSPTLHEKQLHNLNSTENSYLSYPLLWSFRTIKERSIFRQTPQTNDHERTKHIDIVPTSFVTHSTPIRSPSTTFHPARIPRTYSLKRSIMSSIDVVSNSCDHAKFSHRHHARLDPQQLFHEIRARRILEQENKEKSTRNVGTLV